MPENAVKRPVSATHTMMTEIVLPNDTNGLGNLAGGRLLHWMDVCAAISAQRHANGICVTAAVDSVEFNCPIRQGEVVILESQVNRAFNTSMEVEINVWAENNFERTRRKCNRAFYTFVLIGEDGRPRRVPPVHPETGEQEERFEAAARRREFRLILSGRLKIEDAAHIKDALLTALDAHR